MEKNRVLKVIDMEKAQEFYSGDEERVSMTIYRLENMLFDKDFIDLLNDLFSRNWNKVCEKVVVI